MAVGIYLFAENTACNEKFVYFYRVLDLTPLRIIGLSHTSTVNERNMLLCELRIPALQPKMGLISSLGSEKTLIRRGFQSWSWPVTG